MNKDYIEVFSRRIQYLMSDVESLLYYIVSTKYKTHTDVMSAYEKMTYVYNEEVKILFDTMENDTSIMYGPGDPGTLRYLVRNIIDNKGHIKLDDYSDEDTDKLVWFLWTLIFAALNNESLSLFEYKVVIVVRDDDVVLIELRYITDDDPVKLNSGSIKQIYLKTVQDFINDKNQE